MAKILYRVLVIRRKEVKIVTSIAFKIDIFLKIKKILILTLHIYLLFISKLYTNMILSYTEEF